MELDSKYITIPNIIFSDKEISINAKYLYGWIYHEIFYGQFNKTIDEICEVLQCSINTARKNLNELKQKKYISVEIKNKNQRIITPLITDKMILDYQSTKNIRDIQNKKEQQQKQIEYMNQQQEEQAKKQKDVIKEFYKRII